jgi:hypothetical protein
MFSKFAFTGLNSALTFLFLLQIKLFSQEAYLAEQTLLVELLCLYFFKCTVY